MSSLSTIEKDSLLIQGYIRRENKFFLSIPSDIMKIFLLFYHLKYEILRFSTKYGTVDELEYLDDNKCIKLSELGKHEYPYILADIEPVKTGIHCWRILTTANKRWFVWAVSEQKEYNEPTMPTYTVCYGISQQSRQWYPKPFGGRKYYEDHNECDKRYFEQFDKDEVDMLLNVDEGKLNICVVGRDKDEYSAKMYNLPIPNKVDQHSGWIPHFILGYEGQKVRMAQIPIQFYGEYIENLFDQTVSGDSM